MHDFYSAIYGPVKTVPTPTKPQDISILTDDAAISNHWNRHFNNQLNRLSSASDHSLVDLTFPKQPRISASPTLKELDTAIYQMRDNKIPGPDSLPAELYKHRGRSLKAHAHQLILQIWEWRFVSGNFKNANIVTISKKAIIGYVETTKGALYFHKLVRFCLKYSWTESSKYLNKSYQNPSVPSILNEVWLIWFLLPNYLKKRPGNKRNWSFSSSMIWFKALDTVLKPSSWKVLKKFGGWDHFNEMAQSLHKSMEGQVSWKVNFLLKLTSLVV